MAFPDPLRQITAPGRASALLAAVLAGDAVVCAIPGSFVQKDLERLGCPPELITAIPVIKGAAAAGLVAGRSRPALGRLTTNALLGYFACAIGAHARNHDKAWQYVAALGVTSLVVAARRDFAENA